MTVLRIVRYAGIGAAVLALVSSDSVASMFGEENGLLSQILTQDVLSYEELRQITDTAGRSMEAAEGLLDTYARVHAGIDELANYTSGAFLRDFKGDLYHVYPGLAQLEYGSQRLLHWEQTHTPSPVTAYEAISAVVGDLSEPLRKEVQAGRQSVDKELLLKSEAAGGFALASLAEESTASYDREVAELRERYERNADPGTAAMIAAHANLVVAEQNSHLIRLLARAVRLDGVDKAVRAGEHIGAMNDLYTRHDATAAFMTDALQPPKMLRFTAPEW